MPREDRATEQVTTTRRSNSGGNELNERTNEKHQQYDIKGTEATTMLLDGYVPMGCVPSSD
jgi:hypothetical protein